MEPERQTSQPATMDSPISPKASAATQVDAGGRRAPLIDGAIFFFLILFAILLPHSIKGAQHAWQIAFLLWMVKLALERKRPFNQPLTVPLLAYVTLSAVSTALSPDPYLSWDRMKIVCLVLAGIVVGQNLKRLSQIRILIVLLVLSGLAAAAFTAWQYTYGVGVRVAYILPQSPLAHDAHIQGDYIITRVNGQEVHTPLQLERAVLQSSPGGMLRIDYVRGFPFHKWQASISRERFIASGLGTQNLRFVRGKPVRAQGTLGHYVIFAEMLMLIACLTWAMLLNTQPHQTGLRIMLGMAFLALTATVFLTETRAALAGLAAGCFFATLMLAGSRARMWATAALLVLVVAAGLWIHHTRGRGWTGAEDPGTQFRTMMWEDGIRLVRQNPWFGVGMETIRNHWPEWNIRAYALFHDQAHFHSDMIQIAVERGLTTLAAWLWFEVAYVIFLFRLAARARHSTRFATGVVVGILASFVAFLVPSLLHYNLGEESLVMIFFFYFGMAVAIDRILKEPAAIDEP